MRAITTEIIVQRLVRALLLQALAEYRAAGRFPKNRDFAQKTPYFIDANGTRCAMAHLMELGGEPDLVAAIARERPPRSTVSP